MEQQYEQALLKDNFIECLRISDRTIVASFAILFVGAVAARADATGDVVALPVGGVEVDSLETALWIVLGIHFVNGLRYLFLLLRAKAIADRLEDRVLRAARLFPAAATNNVMTESFVTGVLSLLTFPIVHKLSDASILLNFGAAFLVSSPFIIGAIASDKYLNAT